MLRQFKNFLFGTLPQDATKFYNGIGGFTVPAGSGGSISRATVTLTDANIKALPTTPFQLVAAPGALNRLVFVFADYYIDTTAGAYTNVDDAGFARMQINGEDVSIYAADNTTDSGTRWKDILVAAQIAQKTFPQATYPDVITNWGNLTYGIGAAGAALLNQPITLNVDNAAAGNYTGGNAANTLIVNTYYAVVP